MSVQVEDAAGEMDVVAHMLLVRCSENDSLSLLENRLLEAGYLVTTAMGETEAFELMFELHPDLLVRSAGVMAPTGPGFGQALQDLEQLIERVQKMVRDSVPPPAPW